MKYNDILKYLGRFGCLTWSVLTRNKSAERKAFHGVIKHVDEDVILFKINGVAIRTVKLENIISFEEKAMLPEITKVKGRDVHWAGGVLIYKDNKKEYDSDR